MSHNTPDRLVHLATMYWQSATLMAAVRLSLFDALGDQSIQVHILADKLTVDPIALDTLCIALTSLELLEKVADNEYRNTKLSQQYLQSNSASSLVGALSYNADVYPLWGKLDQVIRNGTTIQDPSKYLGDNPEYTSRFVYGMHHRALTVGKTVIDALHLDKTNKIADIGGGPGTYAALMAQNNPNLHVDVLDLPGVVKVAQNIIHEMNATPQVQCKAFDYYTDELPNNSYDGVLISGVLHREQAPQVKMILRKAAACLKSGGKLWISDVMLNDTRSGPLFSALFALNMRVLSHDGRCHSALELTEWLNQCDFVVEKTQILPPPINYTVITATRR